MVTKLELLCDIALAVEAFGVSTPSDLCMYIPTQSLLYTNTQEAYSNSLVRKKTTGRPKTVNQIKRPTRFVNILPAPMQLCLSSATSDDVNIIPTLSNSSQHSKTTSVTSLNPYPALLDTASSAEHITPISDKRQTSTERVRAHRIRKRIRMEEAAQRTMSHNPYNNIALSAEMMTEARQISITASLSKSRRHSSISVLQSSRSNASPMRITRRSAAAMAISK
ncbi:hypothetical protein BATDEDRAFT_27262 [Batrachochytrium dendrobatidis JAM81]|uniref:Uncharacterized protein n=2 Tax=Batrachochytrium dendrobatidis TaxID=109871 RepID=F4P9Y0_BATDJ|nr:uncharacterized protein BATDEDRAFT_27262 [Batrachochytrium dendrobatidis JAM81]EGF77908.1 hypothetical protein BATDEDRAFT_27262 [Batrachochytrium dendrobatidis JAM81]KAJ8330046.1 hypothetical protein O5D80_001624 [Batrachochytrium dendrobatidis]KAK5670534.1 hypothetical protein QVD99_003213 [Batrachochytrium dendrobatidis]OAJ44179.1 hypothetical protein BDEG_27443 [Batrachochytrium dendrobatidis JEL423]|eukprot:XP_006681423.1 hypothetical protein BATDEDRAFT_27262 [Batrachochytrium dendrobatidis JAM81]